MQVNMGMNLVKPVIITLAVACSSGISLAWPDHFSPPWRLSIRDYKHLLEVLIISIGYKHHGREKVVCPCETTQALPCYKKLTN